VAGLSWFAVHVSIVIVQKLPEVDEI
jgi:hypothetical protein